MRTVFLLYRAVCARGRSDAPGMHPNPLQPNHEDILVFLEDSLGKRVSAEHILTGGGSSQGEKTKAEKRIELDLDDGLKVNYGKLGSILAKVKGLNA